MLQKSRQKDCEKGCAEQEEEQVVGDLYNLHGGPPHLWGVFKLGLWKEADFVAVLPDLVKFLPRAKQVIARIRSWWSLSNL